jgi:hypothetical protein
VLKAFRLLGLGLYQHASRQGFRSSKKTAIEQSSHAKQMGFDF